MYAHIRCDLKPSRYLVVWLTLCSVWFYSTLCVIQLPLLSPWCVLILKSTAWLVWSGYTVFILKRDYFFDSRGSVRAIVYNKGQWQLEMKKQQYVTVSLNGESVVWYRLMVLGFVLPTGKMRFVTLFADSARDDILRQLRVELRLIMAQQQSDGWNAKWQQCMQWLQQRWQR